MDESIARYESALALYGHSAGDSVLKTTAQRIRRAVRTEDTVARVGGDEFAVLLAMPSQDTLARLKTKLEQTIARPIQLGNGHLRATASVGRVCVPPGGTDALTLLQQADAEMHRVKRLRVHADAGVAPVQIAV